MATKERVLIVGGGFGGVKAALELSEDSRFQVSLLSDQAELRYYPTLYRTATGGKRSNSSIPLRGLFSDKPVHLYHGSAAKLDRASKTIRTAEGVGHAFDTLILSLGVATNYFGIEGLKEYSYSIKSQTEVEHLKAHLHQQLESNQTPDLNYVIVGAGPTGIELAGALPGYLRRIMENHGVKRVRPHIDLIEAAPRLLPKLPKSTSRAVRRRLRQLGIRIYLGKSVQGQTAEELMVAGKPIRSHTVIWTAGVTNHPFFRDNEFVLMKSGKVAVDTYLQAEENIFVIGDNAHTPYSGLAQTALRDGSFVADNLKRRASGRDLESYRAKRPIVVIPAGPRWAAVSRGKLRLTGWTGWVLREVADLVGFHDLEPWDKAVPRWWSEFSTQDNCAVCAAAETQ